MRFNQTLFASTLGIARYTLYVVVLTGLLCTSGGTATKATQQVTCARETGWFVRICGQKTEAPDGIDISVGVGGNQSTHRFWKRWRHGNPTEFPFPIDLVRAKEVWFKAQTANRGRTVYLGFGFNGRVVKHLDMDGDAEEYEQSRDDDTDEFRCP